MPELTDLARVKQLIATPELPELGPGPRAAVQPLPELNQRMDSLLGKAPAASPASQLVRAVVFLWHDHLDAAHGICQEIENADGSYVHAILHRREPDFGNAKYWFRRVGKHACFPALAAQGKVMLDSRKERGLSDQILPRGEWDPFAFVDACAQVQGKSDAKVTLLRAIQQAEFEILLEHLCSRAR